MQKKNKILNFNTANRKENLWNDVLRASPLSQETSNAVKELLEQPDIDVFLAKKLKAATVDTVDLACYLIEMRGIMPPETRLQSHLENVMLDLYIVNRIQKLAQRFSMQIASPASVSMFRDTSEEVKRQSLTTMLKMSEEGEIHAAGIVSELLDAPQEQILSMIEYIGRFNDPRTFNLLKYFAIASEISIRNHALFYMGYTHSLKALSFLDTVLKEMDGLRDSRTIVIQALQKIVYSGDIPDEEISVYRE